MGKASPSRRSGGEFVQEASQGAAREATFDVKGNVYDAHDEKIADVEVYAASVNPVLDGEELVTTTRKQKRKILFSRETSFSLSLFLDIVV